MFNFQASENWPAGAFWVHDECSQRKIGKIDGFTSYKTEAISYHAKTLQSTWQSNAIEERQGKGGFLTFGTLKGKNFSNALSYSDMSRIEH